MALPRFGGENRASALPRFGGAVGIHPGHWCPASAQPCEHAVTLGPRRRAMSRTGACASSRLSGNSFPSSSIPQFSFIPFSPLPASRTPAYGYRFPNSFPSLVSGKKGALVAIPWLPKSLQVHRQMGKNRYCMIALFLVMPCIAYGYVAVGYARLRQGAERYWSNPNGQIPAGDVCREG